MPLAPDHALQVEELEKKNPHFGGIHGVHYHVLPFQTCNISIP